MQGCLQDNTQLACQVLHKLDWMLLTDPFQFRLLYEISVVCNRSGEENFPTAHRLIDTPHPLWYQSCSTRLDFLCYLIFSNSAVGIPNPGQGW